MADSLYTGSVQIDSRGDLDQQCPKANHKADNNDTKTSHSFVPLKIPSFSMSTGLDLR
jgi:hypothetical protein